MTVARVRAAVCGPRAVDWACGGARWVSVLAIALTACGAALVAPTARAGTLPDGRAFELVSPPNTAGNAAIQSVGNYEAFPSDDAVIFGEGVQPDGPSPSGSDPVYLSTRTATGWSSTSLLPATATGAEEWLVEAATPSLSDLVFGVETPVLFTTVPPTQPDPELLEYRDSAGNFSTIVNDTPDLLSAGGSYTVGGLSNDGQTLVYSSNITPSGTLTPGGVANVYAWHPGSGAQTLPSSSSDPLSGCGPSVIQGGAGTPNAISSDGSTVFVQSTGGASPCPASSQVYAIVDGRSQEISVSTDGISDPQDSAAPATFVGATPDGQTAYFTTSQPLTASAGAGSSVELYQWSAPTGTTAAQVTCISCAPTNDNGLFAYQPGSGLVVSDQGDYVYFQEEAPTSTGATYEEYVEHAGTVDLVDNSPTGFGTVGYGNNEEFVPSADGNVVVFEPVAPSTGGNLYPPSPDYRAVVSGSSVSTPQCITCAADGAVGVANIGAAGAPFNSGMTADGNTIVYLTTNGLGSTDPGDSDQVYEWTPSGGPQFIANAYYAGGAAISPDGQDIFFYSTDALVPQDVQTGVAALYDARVDGGFPAPPTPASCSGDACQPASPGGSAPATGVTAGCCGQVHSETRLLALRALSPSVLRAAGRTGRLTLRLQTHGSGLLLVAARARLGRQTRTVASARRRLSGDRTQTVTLRLRLSASARRDLTRVGRLSLRIAATLPGARPQSMRVTLRAAASHPSSTGGRS